MALPDSSSDYYQVVANMIRSLELVSPQLEQVLLALVRRGYISVEQSNALLELAGSFKKE